MAGRRSEFDAGLAARLLQQTGGFSLQRTSGRQPPKKGYMVSDYGSEEIKPGLASPREIADYHRSNPNPTPIKRYVGGWYEGGQTYLDQSRRVLSPKKAQAIGQAEAQKAVYSLGREAVRPVHYGGPVDVRGTLFEGNPTLHRELRAGNDAAWQQRAFHERLITAGNDAGRAVAHRPHPQPRLPGMRGY